MVVIALATLGSAASALVAGRIVVVVGRAQRRARADDARQL
jgi:hypothetical protein